MDSKNFLIKWIRHFAQPNSDIESELHRIHGNSINSFVKAINKAQEQYVPTTYPEASPQLIEDESFSDRIHSYSKRIGEYQNDG